MSKLNQSVHKILLIDDDFTSSSVLKSYLESKKQYQVDWEKDGEAGLAACNAKSYDCVILDINLPLLNGFELLRILRNQGNTAQVLITSVRGREEDIILGLQLGGDDYLIKPFSMPELGARLAARIRRCSNPTGKYTKGEQSVNLDDLTIESGGKKSKLTAREGRLLKIFLENPGRVLSRDQILDMVWGVDYMGTSRTVDNFVLNLRKKLESSESAMRIETVRGLGYKLSQ